MTTEAFQNVTYELGRECTEFTNFAHKLGNNNY